MSRGPASGPPALGSWAEPDSFVKSSKGGGGMGGGGMGGGGMGGGGKGEGGPSHATAYGEGASALWAQDKTLANKFERKQAGQKSAHEFDRPSNKRPKKQ